jgi:hypothetical protein
MSFYERVSERPFRFAIVSASIIFVWTFFLSQSSVIAAGVGIATFALAWLLWRSGGPGHRLRAWTVQRFPKAIRPASERAEHGDPGEDQDGE